VQSSRPHEARRHALRGANKYSRRSGDDRRFSDHHITVVAVIKSSPRRAATSVAPRTERCRVTQQVEAATGGLW
jgi:hypothetical protein